MHGQDLPVRQGSIYSAAPDEQQGLLPPSTSASDRRAGIAALLEEGASHRAGAPSDADTDTHQALSSANAQLQVVVHVLAATLAVSVPLDIYNGTLFCWHPIFMTIGFAGLMAEAVVIAVSLRGLEGAQRVAAIQRHMYVQLASLACVAVGFWAIWQNKVNHSKPHFTSYHGKVGVTTTAAAVVVAAGGALAFRKLGALQHLPVWLQDRTKQAHRLAGPLVLAAAFVNIVIGLRTKAAGPRVVLHLWQEAAVVALGAAEAWLLFGDVLCRRLGLTRCGKSA